MRFKLLSHVLTNSMSYGNQRFNAAFIKAPQVVLGGLGVTCSPRDPRFAGSNPAEVDGFFQDNPEHKSSGRDFKLGVPSLRFQARGCCPAE